MTDYHSIKLHISWLQIYHWSQQLTYLFMGLLKLIRLGKSLHLGKNSEKYELTNMIISRSRI